MRYYDFTMNGERVGYYEVDERPGVLHANARMRIDGGTVERAFWVRHVDGLPTEVKVGDSCWQRVPRGAFPTSAYPLVLRRGMTRYRALVEGTGEIDERELRREGGLVVEWSRGRVMRTFEVRDGQVVAISWGGAAESRLVASKEDATRGTAFDAPPGGTS
jgi:hypothetical protein